MIAEKHSMGHNNILDISQPTIGLPDIAQLDMSISLDDSERGTGQIYVLKGIANAPFTFTF